MQRESLNKQRESLRQQIGVKVEETNSDFEFSDAHDTAA